MALKTHLDKDLPNQKTKTQKQCRLPKKKLLLLLLMIVSLLFHALLFFSSFKIFYYCRTGKFFFSFYIVGVENETHKKKENFVSSLLMSMGGWNNPFKLSKYNHKVTLFLLQTFRHRRKKKIISSFCHTAADV